MRTSWRVVVVLAVVVVVGLVGPAVARVRPPLVSDLVASLSCSGAHSCTAVGNGYAWRWDGRRWGRLPSWPKNIAVGLSGVSCSSPNACKTVGSEGVMADCSAFASPGQPPPQPTAAFVARASRGGSFWVFDQPPPLDGANPCQVNSGLVAISCSTLRFCMAIGSYVPVGGGRVAGLATRWDGARWTSSPTAAVTGTTNVNLSSLSCSSSMACTAVGSRTEKGSTSPLAEYWNGHGWVMQPTAEAPGAGSGTLTGVSCGSVRSCIAVGVYDEGARTLALAERWNGSNWTVQRMPQPRDAGNAILLGVSCSSPSACTAVGRAGADLAFAERWNGRRWVLQRLPGPGRPESSLLASTISCATATSCAAVLTYVRITPFGTYSNLTLPERWNGTRWTAQGFRFLISP